MLRPARHETIRVRALDIHARRWGPEPAAGESPIVLLHGFQDTGDTFQFLVDALERERALLALDWRGFGRSGWAAESYWFPDYLADLDQALDALSPGEPAHLIGHSMGGNVASLYAGLRPQRVRSHRQSRRIRAASRPVRAGAGAADRVAGRDQVGSAAQKLPLLRRSRRHHPHALSAIRRRPFTIHRRGVG